MAKESTRSSRRPEKERRREEKQRNRPVTKQICIDSIYDIAKYYAHAEIDDYHKLNLFLRSWWCRTYSRPLKDPLLATYTLEELIYEFYDYVERRNAAENLDDERDDKIEEDHKQEVLDWAEMEERKEFGDEAVDAVKAAQVAALAAAKQGPSQDDLDWMNKKMEEAKSVHGDTFGEDIDDGDF